jgi:hypothetical protein
MQWLHSTVRHAALAGSATLQHHIIYQAWHEHAIRQPEKPAAHPFQLSSFAATTIGFHPPLPAPCRLPHPHVITSQRSLQQRQSHHSNSQRLPCLHHLCPADYPTRAITVCGTGGQVVSKYVAPGTFCYYSVGGSQCRWVPVQGHTHTRCIPVQMCCCFPLDTCKKRHQANCQVSPVIATCIRKEREVGGRGVETAQLLL